MEVRETNMNHGKKKFWLIIVIVVVLIIPGIFAYIFYGKFYEEEKLYTKKLENGLEVIVYEKHDGPIATLLMVVRAGAQIENSGLDGLAHLHEHVFVYGLRDNSTIPEDLRKKVENVPFNYYGMTSYAYSIYTFTPFLTEDTEKAMILLSDGFLNPWMGKSDQELQSVLSEEKTSVLAEYDRNQSEPYFAMQKAKIRNLWTAYPSIMDVIGDRKEVASATIGELRYIGDKFYIPNNCALIVAGDVNHEEIFELAEKYFWSWEPGKDPFSDYPYKNPPLNRSAIKVVQGDVSQIRITISFIGPGCCEEREDTYPMDILLNILNNPSSRFQKKMVDSGLFTSCHVSYLTLSRDSSIDFVGDTTPKKFRQAHEALLEEIESLGEKGYFTREELKNGKLCITNQEVWEGERSNEYAHTLAFWWSSCGLDYYNSYEKNIKSTSYEDLEEFIDEYIVREPHVSIILISPKDLKSLNLSKGDSL
ncbi:MAG TPA: insulinase family protein [Thermoplasmata archaeon]|nr:insulinase family protein [Thermoplasmata archaeon]